MLWHHYHPSVSPPVDTGLKLEQPDTDARMTLNNTGFEMGCPSPLLDAWASSYDLEHPLVDIGAAFGRNTAACSALLATRFGPPDEEGDEAMAGRRDLVSTHTGEVSSRELVNTHTRERGFQPGRGALHRQSQSETNN
jgi:hypothetical protein